MNFLETPRFPPCVSIVARMGPTFKTYVAETAAGVEVRDEQYSLPRQVFNFAHVPMGEEEHLQLCTFFENRAGRAGAFRVKHPADFRLTASNSQLVPMLAGVAVGTAGVGYGIPIYAIRRLRTYGAITTTRTVTKPVSGSINAVRAGVTATIGVGAGNVAIDTATGLITFVADQSKAISAHTPAGDHVLTAATAFSPNFVVGGRVYITAVTGTAATILNDQSHEITDVTADVITIATQTTGLTASGGFAWYYPQPNQTLTALGEFDYPCRFTSDEASFEIVDRNITLGLLWQWSGIDLIEVKGE